jgi:glutathione-regulated potassium-efflux system protein KefB
VVLGAALLMQVSGLSMAMGAFLAGVLLSESTLDIKLKPILNHFEEFYWGYFSLVLECHWIYRS